MSNLLVNIIAGNTEIEGSTIGSKARIGDIAIQVAEATGHPITDDKSNPIIYSFKHNDNLLDPKETFSEYGIKKGDRLILTDGRMPVTGGEKLDMPTGNNIEVIIVLPDHSKHKKSLPVDMNVIDLRNDIITANNLGDIKSLEFRSRHLGRLLTEGTLRSNSVPHLDHLSLTTDATAG